MLLSLLFADSVKNLLFLPVAYYSLLLSSRLFGLRFADKRTIARSSLALTVGSFLSDLLNVYLVAYAPWSEILRLIPLLAIMMLYLAASLFLIWAYLRDTHKKTLRVWAVFAAAYLAYYRLAWLFLPAIFSFLGLSFP